MKKSYGCLLRSIFIPATFVVAYFGTVISAQAYEDISLPKIESQSELELKLSEERVKLNHLIPADANIEITFDSDTSATKLGPNHYIIRINKKYGSNNVGSIRHELGHIALGHLEKYSEPSLPFILEYLFMYEPFATLYSRTGIIVR